MCLKKINLVDKYQINTWHCLKSFRIRSYSGSYFSAFGVNTERYSVSLRMPVFNPNAGKYGPEWLRIRTLFTQQNRGESKEIKQN